MEKGCDLRAIVLVRHTRRARGSTRADLAAETGREERIGRQIPQTDAQPKEPSKEALRFFGEVPTAKRANVKRTVSARLSSDRQARVGITDCELEKGDSWQMFRQAIVGRLESADQLGFT